MDLPNERTETSYKVTLCGKGSCKCPSVEISKDKDSVLIGGEEEGYSVFTKEQFELLVQQSKEGHFDKYF